MSKKAEEYEKALQMIDARIAQFSDVFDETPCDEIIDGPALTRRGELLMHLLDELAVLNVYNARGNRASRAKDLG